MMIKPVFATWYAESNFPQNNQQMHFYNLMCQHHATNMWSNLHVNLIQISSSDQHIGVDSSKPAGNLWPLKTGT